MGITELQKSQGSRNLVVTSCYTSSTKKSVPCNQKAQSVSVYLPTYMTLALPWQGNRVLVRVGLFLKVLVEYNWPLKSIGLVMPLPGHVTEFSNSVVSSGWDRYLLSNSRQLSWRPREIIMDSHPCYLLIQPLIFPEEDSEAQREEVICKDG